MISLEEMVLRKLKTVQYVLSCVESCTGGLVANLLTNTPGASEIFWGSYVTYDNSAKEQLGVSEGTLLRYGAVSPEVAMELAQFGLEKTQAWVSQGHSKTLMKPKGYLCLSTTGIAGPSGGTAQKPVGLCYLGLAISGRQTIVEEVRADSSKSRLELKAEFAQRALELIRNTV